MTHDAFAVYSAGVALGVCSCGWRERLEHGTRGQAQTLADEHARLAAVLEQSQPADDTPAWASCW